MFNNYPQLVDFHTFDPFSSSHSRVVGLDNSPTFAGAQEQRDPVEVTRSEIRSTHDGTDPSGDLQDRIEAERRRLQKASAVLIALVYSLNQALDSEQAGDVAGVALDRRLAVRRRTA